jgi:hypothetical protein
MRYLRLYTGPDGGSHFEDTDVMLAPVEFIPGRPRVDLSPPASATGTAFIRLPAGWDSGGRLLAQHGGQHRGQRPPDRLSPGSRV